MDNLQDSNLKFGVNWSYLKTLLDIYERMLSDQHTLLTTIAKCSGINPKVAYSNLASSVYSFYISVESQYGKSKENFKSEHFTDLLNTLSGSSERNVDKLLQLSRSLSLWATSKGVFATLTEHINLDEKW